MKWHYPAFVVLNSIVLLEDVKLILRFRLPDGALGSSVKSKCGIYWSYSLTFSRFLNRLLI